MSCLKVLVVDDNPDVARSLSLLLKINGHITSTAANADEAIARTVEFHPEVVLLDIGLPDRNGFQVAQEIRALAKGKDVLLVAVSGWASNEDRVRSKASGFDHHLRKPVTYAELAALFPS